MPLTPPELGEQRGLPGALDLSACPMRMWRGEKEVSSGTGAACLGHPATAVAWLAATARSYGIPLRAGEIVLPGAPGYGGVTGRGARCSGRISATSRCGTVRCLAGSRPAKPACRICSVSPCDTSRMSRPE